MQNKVNNMKTKITYFMAIFLVLALAWETALAFNEKDGYLSPVKVYDQNPIPDETAVKNLNGSSAWLKFNTRYDGRFMVDWNTNSKTPHLVITSGMKLTTDLNQSNIQEVSERFINENSELLGVTSSELKLQTAGFHGGMWYVVFDRYYDGLLVYNARVNLTYSTSGALVAFGSDSYPDINVNTSPTINQQQAIDIVRSSIEYPSEKDSVISTQLLVLPLQMEGEFSVHLAWKIVYFCPDLPARWYMFVDAHDGELLMYWDAIMYDFTGNVSGDVQLDGAFAPFYNLPFKDLTVNANGYGSDDTDENGNYSIPGNDSATITAQLKGPYVDVNRVDGTDASFSGSSWGNLDIDWTAISQNQERDGYYNTTVVHDYINYVDPYFYGMDWQVPCNINLPGACNAYWDGNGINFYREGGGCPNIVLMSTVVYHEYGHGITQFLYEPNDLPYFGESGGLNEGWSDFIANCITDQALMGRGWSGPGTYLRSSDNNNQYPGIECGGEPHCMGDIMVGALWHMRAMMVDNYGDGIKPYVDSLWHYARYALPMNYFDYLWQLLLYDDDDSDIYNGTPHAPEIIYSFVYLHNIDPGFRIEIEHTPLGDSEDSLNAFPISAEVTGFFPIEDGSVVTYYTTGEDFIEVEMENVSGDIWSGEISPQSFGTTVSYYIQAVDNAGMIATDPEDAPDSLYSFYVGYDVIPPTLELVYSPPNTINLFGPYGPFIFRAWDTNSIDTTSAQFHYVINFGDESVVSMETGDQEDEFVLEALDLGTVLQTGDIIHYWFTCQDGAINPNTGRLPEEGSFTLEMVITELIDDFEDGLDEWQVVGTGWVHFDQGYNSSYGVKSSLDDYENNMNSLLYLVEPYNLSLFDYVRLGFMHKNLILPGDTCFVLASVDPSGPWTILGAISGFDYWSYDSFELEGFSGPGYDEVYVGFQFVSDDSETLFGIIIDDVEISIEPPVGFDEDVSIPRIFALNQNYPNPFNIKTIISFNIPEPSKATIDIFDILGRKVACVFDGLLEAGRHQILWDGRNSDGDEVTSGIYFYRLKSNERSEIKSMTLIK
ncbi:MAG: hypothetical protein DRP26_01945 [Candidatus Zixiibacteriota bacterium]|nr:MAG: hypothetical protein DRP26_01945 [candidate division Zixibacteria bacterium]